MLIDVRRLAEGTQRQGTAGRFAGLVDRLSATIFHPAGGSSSRAPICQDLQADREDAYGWCRNHCFVFWGLDKTKDEAPSSYFGVFEHQEIEVKLDFLPC